MKLVVIENPRPLSMEHYNDVANAPLSASLNSGYALAVARRAGWDVAFLDFTTCCDNEQALAGAILAEGADMVLLHWVYAWGHEAFVRDVLELVKNRQDVPVGAFGLFPTLCRSRLMEYAPQLDFIIAGEFEKSLDELLCSFEKRQRLNTVVGLVLRDKEYLRRDVIEDLSWLPVPDDVGTNCRYTTMNIAASRGCFGNCGFCFINRFYGCSRRRQRSIASLEAEIEIRLQRRVIDQLYFIDPTFIGYGTEQKQRIAAIGGIAKAAGIPFGFETRVDTVNEEIVSSLAHNGASSIFLGIESGCDSVLQRINKNVTTQQIVNAVHCIRKSGIPLTVGFIMFEPDSTVAELAENYDFLEKLGLLSDHGLTANLLYHSQIMLYGSTSWERFEKEGRLLLDEKLTFEAGYRFKNDDVGRVCTTMRRLASAYFLGMDAARNRGVTTVDGPEVNRILKEAFCVSLRHAGCSGRGDYNRMEQEFLDGLNSAVCSGSIRKHLKHGETEQTE